MFEPDIQANAETLIREIKGKKVCVIGGAGSIGSSFIKAVLRFEPESVVVVDLNENGLAELVRDVRSTQGLYVPGEFRYYTLNFADPIFERIFRGEKIDMRRFQALGVVEQTTRHSFDEVAQFFGKLEGIFADETFTKAEVVDAIKEFIPNFEHEEKGKNLDQKM